MPQLAWGTAPKGTKSFAIFVLDTSVSGTFYHLGAYNIAASRKSIPAGFSLKYDTTAKNDADVQDYYAPCPPIGETHTYSFQVMALNTKLPSNSKGDYYVLDLYKDVTKGKYKKNVLTSGKTTATFTIVPPDPSTITDQWTCLDLGFTWHSSSSGPSYCSE